MPRNIDRTVSQSIVRHTVAALDCASIFAGGVVVMHLCDPAIEWRLLAFFALLGTIIGANILGFAGAYDFASYGKLASSLSRVVAGALLTFATLFLVASLLDPVNAATGSWIGRWLVVALAFMIACRLIVWRRMIEWQRRGCLNSVVAIVGAGPVAQRLLRNFSAGGARPRVLGVYDDDAACLPAHCMGHRILGTVDDLVVHARECHIDAVIVALPPSAEGRLVDTLNKLCLVPVDVHLSPDAFGLQFARIRTSHVAGRTFLNVIDRPLADWRSIAKSIEDRLLGTAILALISPLLLVIALLIKLDSPGPVLFRQKRYGFNNELFEVLKFRTMYADRADPDANQLTRRNDPRVTRIGALLRRTSLDELPQFLNVVRGDMSIVGPRPHALAAKAGSLPYQDAVKYYDARHRVKPGITGWAQINGWRGETDTLEQIQKRVEHDLYYIDHWSILLDLKIILRTIVGGFTGRHAF